MLLIHYMDFLPFSHRIVVMHRLSVIIGNRLYRPLFSISVSVIILPIYFNDPNNTLSIKKWTKIVFLNDNFTKLLWNCLKSEHRIGYWYRPI